MTKAIEEMVESVRLINQEVIRVTELRDSNVAKLKGLTVQLSGARKLLSYYRQKEAELIERIGDIHE